MWVLFVGSFDVSDTLVVIEDRIKCRAANESISNALLHGWNRFLHTVQDSMDDLRVMRTEHGAVMHDQRHQTTGNHCEVVDATQLVLLRRFNVFVLGRLGSGYEATPGDQSIGTGGGRGGGRTGLSERAEARW